MFVDVAIKSTRGYTYFITEIDNVMINDDLRHITVVDRKEFTLHTKYYNTFYFDEVVTLKNLNRAMPKFDFTYYDGYCVEYQDFNYYISRVRDTSSSRAYYNIVYFHEDDDEIHHIYTVNKVYKIIINDSQQNEDVMNSIKDRTNVDDYIPREDILSDETYACSVEQLMKLPVSYVHEGVLYKRHVISHLHMGCFTRYKPLCIVTVPVNRYQW